MSNRKGTLGWIVGELAAMLSPLVRDLTPDRAPGLFAALGIPISAEQAVALADALGPSRSSALLLIDAVNELDAAALEGDTTTVIAKAADAAIEMPKVIAAIGALAARLRDLPGLSPEIIDALPRRTLTYLLSRYLSRQAVLCETLELFGILEREDFNVESDDPAQPFYTLDTFHFERIGGWLRDPQRMFAELYDWGTPAFDGQKLFRAVDRFVVPLGLPAHLDESGETAILDLFALTLSAKTDVTPAGVAVRLAQKAVPATVERSAGDWRVVCDANLPLLSGTELVIQPSGVVSIAPPEATTVSGALHFSYEVEPTPDAPLTLIGTPEGSRLTAEKLGLDLALDLAWDGTRAHGALALAGRIDRGMIVLTSSGADTLVGRLIGGATVEVPWDLAFSYSPQDGLRFQGSPTLELQITPQSRIGGIEIASLTVSLGIAEDAFPVMVAADILAQLGPVSTVITGVGMRADVALRSEHDGNLGPIELAIGFQPPRGLGLFIDAGIVVGAGFVEHDPETGRYAGVLVMGIYGLTLTAICVADTRRPEVPSGFSMVFILATEFPPVQLGLGFTLNGLGGLAAINRAVAIDAFRSGLRDGSLDSLLFPDDPFASAARIVEDLDRLMPPAAGVHAFGPSIVVGWGTPTIAEAEIAVLVELPAATRVVILGQIAVLLPSRLHPIVELHLDALGTVDLARKELAIDATLHHSYIALFDVSGDMALRMNWGDQPSFTLAVGGFHPRFAPPSGFPSLRRLTLALGAPGQSPLVLQAYLAVTSNTVQLGARVDMNIEAGGFALRGWLGFDALLTLSPFSFLADISGGLKLLRDGTVLAGIWVDATISGPRPWRIVGQASASVLFVDVTVQFDVRFGQTGAVELPPVDPRPLLQEAMGDTRNWAARLPLGVAEVVTFVPRAADLPALLDPASALTLRQKVVPLGRRITRFGAAVPVGPDRYDVSEVTLDGRTATDVAPIEDFFAPAQYAAMTDAERLSRASFESMQSGVSVGEHSLAMGIADGATPTYRTTRFDRGERREDAPYVPSEQAQAHGDRRRVSTPIATRSRLGRFTPPAAQRARVSLDRERYVVASTDDLARRSDISPGGSRGAVEDALAEHLANHPRDRGRFQVVREGEAK